MEDIYNNIKDGLSTQNINLFLNNLRDALNKEDHYSIVDGKLKSIYEACNLPYVHIKQFSSENGTILSVPFGHIQRQRTVFAKGAQKMDYPRTMEVFGDIASTMMSALDPLIVSFYGYSQRGDLSLRHSLHPHREVVMSHYMQIFMMLSRIPKHQRPDNVKDPRKWIADILLPGYLDKGCKRKGAMKKIELLLKMVEKKKLMHDMLFLPFDYETGMLVTSHAAPYVNRAYGSHWFEPTAKMKKMRDGEMYFETTGRNEGFYHYVVDKYCFNFYAGEGLETIVNPVRDVDTSVYVRFTNDDDGSEEIHMGTIKSRIERTMENRVLGTYDVEFNFDGETEIVRCHEDDFLKNAQGELIMRSGLFCKDRNGNFEIVSFMLIWWMKNYGSALTGTAREKILEPIMEYAIVMLRRGDLDYPKPYVLEWWREMFYLKFDDKKSHIINHMDRFRMLLDAMESVPTNTVEAEKRDEAQQARLAKVEAELQEARKIIKANEKTRKKATTLQAKKAKTQQAKLEAELQQAKRKLTELQQTISEANEKAKNAEAAMQIAKDAEKISEISIMRANERAKEEVNKANETAARAREEAREAHEKAAQYREEARVAHEKAAQYRDEARKANEMAAESREEVKKAREQIRRAMAAAEESSAINMRKRKRESESISVLSSTPECFVFHLRNEGLEELRTIQNRRVLEATASVPVSEVRKSETLKKVSKKYFDSLLG